MFLVALFLWQTAFDLTKVDVEGLDRFTPESVLTMVSLKPGMKAGKPEFDAACQRLIGSGLFQACNWKYMPSSNSGVALVLQLTEAKAGQAVRLNVAGVDESKVWEWLSANEPLVQRQMPESDAAIQFYTRAVQRYLKQDITASVETNLETHENTLVFRPANIGRVRSARFSGAQAMDAGALEKAFSAAAADVPGTEYDVRRVLDANIRPMYENVGRLAVRFPSVRIENGVVTVQVEEGPVYTVGKAQVTGAQVAPKFPVGERAEWNRILNAAEEAAKPLRNKGYLHAKYTIDRQLNADTNTVDLTVAYAPGQAFTFNSLELHGLNRPQETNVRALWKLPAGAPMNEGYVDQFVQAALQKLGPEYSGVGQQMEPATPSSVNVVITFTRN